MGDPITINRLDTLAIRIPAKSNIEYAPRETMYNYFCFQPALYLCQRYCNRTTGIDD